MILRELDYRIQFGIELEFYIEEIEKECFLRNIKNKITSLNFFCEEESSIHQYEIKSCYYTSSSKLVKYFKVVKELVAKTAQGLGGNASFKAKPYLDKAGSALNINVSLVDLNNRNFFHYDKQRYSDYLIYSIGGLCAMMKDQMSFFAPNSNSYLRFKYPDIHTPTTVSWGINNRTTAIRVLPSKRDFFSNRKRCRLEHRVPGADCNLKKVISVIKEGIILGIENKIAPPDIVYGIASDPQYAMKSLI